MVLTKILVNAIAGFMNSLKAGYKLARVQSHNPTCKFYEGVEASKTTFGQYNVIFRNVLIDSSVIGSHTYVQKNTTIFNSTIGKFCSIATNVSIGPGRHSLSGVSTHPVFFLHNTPLVKKYSSEDLVETAQPVTIGHDVWIGEKSIILNGVTIGTGAVIAAGSIVNKDVPPYAIVGGSPAKLIRYRFDEAVIGQLLQSEWWNRDEQWLQANYKSFLNPEHFLKIAAK